MMQQVPLTVIYITALMLFAGAAPLPYGYYTLLRLVATCVFAWSAFLCYERKSPILPWVFGLLALLFNPIFKIHLTKEVWIVIDIGAGLALLLTKRHLQKIENKNL